MCIRDRWKGKLHRFCNPNREYLGEFIAANAMIQVHHYLGTAKAATVINELVRSYEKEIGNLKFETTFSHILSAEVVIDGASNQDLVSLISNYYDKTIEKNTHLGGDVSYGYRQCGLPVVLDHNSPNNSIALIWARGEHADVMRPLFPRKQRHVEHGQSV